MARIIEVQESKLEHLAEYAECMIKYGKKIMTCLHELKYKDEDEEEEISYRRYL